MWFLRQEPTLLCRAECGLLEAIHGDLATGISEKPEKPLPETVTWATCACFSSSAAPPCSFRGSIGLETWAFDRWDAISRQPPKSSHQSSFADRKNQAMSEIFIEWDRDRLVVARGRAEGNCAEITESWIIERSADSADMFAVVDQLKPIARAAAGKTRPQVTVIFPRQFVAIHRIQLPQVADTEMPDMVRMQATMRLTVPVESVSMDFAPLPVIPGSMTRDVLLVTAPADQVAQARTTLQEAGLELKELRVSAFCLAQAAAQAGVLTESTDASLVEVVVLMRRDFIEVTFIRGTAVLFSHSGNSWSAADAIERTLRSELTRARMSAAESLGEHKIRRILLIGAAETTAAVTDQFASRFDSARIERIDPAGIFVRGSLAVSVCYSSRFTATAAETGVETVPAFRGQGCAGLAVTAWADAVRRAGRLPFYSTSWENAASRSVAAMLELIEFGEDIHLT